MEELGNRIVYSGGVDGREGRFTIFQEAYIRILKFDTWGNGGENEKVRFYSKKCLHFIFGCDSI